MIICGTVVPPFPENLTERRPTGRDGVRRRSDSVSGSRCAALLFLLAVQCASTPASAGPSAHLAARGDGRRVSVAATDAPVSRILRAIGNAAGIPIVLDPALDARLEAVSATLTAEDVRPEEALRRLLPEHQLVFVYSARAPSSKRRRMAAAASVRRCRARLRDGG